MFVKGLLIEARPRVFRDFHNSFGLPMFSVNFALKIQFSAYWQHFYHLNVVLMQAMLYIHHHKPSDLVLFSAFILNCTFHDKSSFCLVLCILSFEEHSLYCLLRLLKLYCFKLFTFSVVSVTAVHLFSEYLVLLKVIFYSLLLVYSYDWI